MAVINVHGTALARGRQGACRGVGKKKRESRRKSERKGFDANGEREKSGGKREKGQEERKGQ